MLLDLQNVESVEWICGGNTGCYDAEIWCPSAHDTSSCHLTATGTDGTTFSGVQIYVDESYTYGFLSIECQVDGGCSTVDVNCEGDADINQANMDYNASDGQYQCRYEGPTYCCPVNPTASPTNAPSTQRSPSLNPSVAPSHAPTDGTESPTAAPSASPTTMSMFDVSDSDGTFSNNTIYCGEVDYCYILCSEHSGCFNTTINASMSSNLVLECTAEDACYGFELVSGPVGRLNITCTDGDACVDGKIEVMGTDHVSILCGGSGPTSWPCWNLFVNVSDAHSVSIGTMARDDSWALSYSQLHFKNTSDITIDAVAEYAFSGGTVYLYSSNTSSGTSGFTLNCDGWDACEDAEVYAVDYECRYLLTV